MSLSHSLSPRYPTGPFHRSAAPRRAVRGVPWCLGALLLLLTVFAGCRSSRPGEATNLLASLEPTRVETVIRPQVLVDGIRATDGDTWQSELAAIFRSTSAFVEYDLGAETPLRAAYLHGDNNDQYAFEGSLDGAKFAPFWTAPAVSGPGLQPRFTSDLNATARFVRIRAQSGDRSFSLSEIGLFSEAPSTFPPRLVQRRGLPQGETVRSSLVVFAAALGAFLFLVWRGAPRLWLLAAAALPLVAAYSLYAELAAAWPVTQREVALVRGLSAAVAALAVLREALLRQRYPSHRGATVTVLAIAAASAFSSFFNLYHPQFHDQKQNAPLFVHNFDMRVYYPVAKYFPELRFDGLYRASVAAMVDDVPGLTLDSPRVSRAELRNLRTHRMERVDQVKEEIAKIPERFSPERWESFKVDMRYFRETMGERDYLGSMHDHGGNATPLWLAITHLIFMGTTASNGTLALAGLLDPLLLALAFAAIWRSFGVRTMLVAIAVWGANDFYMFGSNWGGATLRHDWMAYLALGACALKSGRFALGGALLGLSAMIRAFPALSLAALVLPSCWYLLDFRRANRRWPRLVELSKSQRPLLWAITGAVGCVVVCLLFSSLLFSFDAWTEWLAKVRMLDRDPHVNHISLRALVAGSGGLQHSILRARWPVFAAGIAVHFAAIIWLARGKSLDQAALLGALLIPIAFNPANYYIHFVFVVPLLAIELNARQRADAGSPPFGRFDGAVWGALLLMCAAQYWTTLVRDTELHFQLATVLYFAGTLAVLAFLAWRDWETIAGSGTPLVAFAGGAPLRSTEPPSSRELRRSTETSSTGGPSDTGESVTTQAQPDDDEDDATASSSAPVIQAAPPADSMPDTTPVPEASAEEPAKPAATSDADRPPKP